MNKEKNSGGRIRKPQHGRRLKWGKQFILLAAIAVLALGIVGGTSAYLLTNTGNVVNTFTPGKVACIIDETFTEGSTKKEHVVIYNDDNENHVDGNVGIVPAYIRAAIIVTWQDEEGNVAPSVPRINTDYSIAYGSGWRQYGDYWYYLNKVEPGQPTSELITKCEVIKDYEDSSYTLHVEILADAIQSEPATAMTEAWGVSMSTIIGQQTSSNG